MAKRNPVHRVSNPTGKRIRTQTTKRQVSKWTESDQKELLGILGVLLSVMVAGYFGFPPDAKYPLLDLLIPLRSFFGLMADFWGASMFLMMISRLPIDKQSQVSFRAQALLFLVVFPALYGLVLWLLALGVRYPVIDPLLAPALAVGAVGIFALFLKMVGGGRSYVRGLKWIIRHIPVGNSQ